MIRSLRQTRVGFWRAQLEFLGLGMLFSLLLQLLAWLNAPAWADMLVSFLSFMLLIAIAWRLAPGTGGALQRVGRLLVWCLIHGVASGTIGWVILVLIPYSRTAFTSISAMILLSTGLTLLTVVPIRVLIVVWVQAAVRLRWQLTLSYLLIGSLTTLLVFIGIGLFAAALSLAQVPLLVSAPSAAERLAAGFRPLVLRDASPAELNPLVQGVFVGTTRLPLAPEVATHDAIDNEAITGLRRLIVVRDDGAVWAAAGFNAPPVGLALSTAERAKLGLLIAQARGGGCVAGRPAAGTIADSAACGILDDQGTPRAVVIIETLAAVDSAQTGAAIGRIIGILSTVLLFLTVGMILAGTVIILLAGGVGYLLARRLTRQIERLTMATADIAAGNLDRRVEVQRLDEIGRLGNDFNMMAARLAERERALLVEKERVEQLYSANRRLIANISHELRTPLATLRGYLEALELSHGPQLPARDMQVIQAEVQRLTGLIDDLFTLARADAQQLPVEIKPTAVSEIIHQLAETLAPLARRERQIEVIATAPRDLPDVLADRARLEQVLLNLAQNALRHTPPGGIVVFEGSVKGGCVCIAVADTGIGISAEELELVFERFYRGDSSRTRETGGAGLGLALARELVTAMGGTISAESIPGRGSRFVVELPCANAAFPLLHIAL